MKNKAKPIRPLHHLVLCEALENAGETAAGILIPWAGRPNRAVVRGLGRGYLDQNGKLHESQLKTGDTVVIRSGRIETVLHEGQWTAENSPVPKGGELFLIGEDNILAVVER